MTIKAEDGRKRRQPKGASTYKKEQTHEQHTGNVVGHSVKPDLSQYRSALERCGVSEEAILEVASEHGARHTLLALSEAAERGTAISAPLAWIAWRAARLASVAAQSAKRQAQMSERLDREARSRTRELQDQQAKAVSTKDELEKLEPEVVAALVDAVVSKLDDAAKRRIGDKTVATSTFLRALVLGEARKKGLLS